MSSASLSLKRRLWNPEARLAYILLLPAVVVLLTFMFYPIIYVFLMAFFKTNKLSQLLSFAGLQNFKELIFTSDFWRITGRSILWTILAVITKILSMVRRNTQQSVIQNPQAL